MNDSMQISGSLLILRCLGPTGDLPFEYLVLFVPVKSSAPNLERIQTTILGEKDLIQFLEEAKVDADRVFEAFKSLFEKDTTQIHNVTLSTEDFEKLNLT
jgi:hypothetical protein